MPFTEEDKHLIKVLREEKRYSSRQLLAEFPTKNWSRGGLDYLLKKIDVSGSIARTAGSGRRRSARTDENIEAVAELVLSQDDKPQSHRTVRQISRELCIPRSSVHEIIKEDLKLKC